MPQIMITTDWQDNLGWPDIKYIAVHELIKGQINLGFHGTLHYP